MKLTIEIERQFYAKFLKALPAGSKAVEQGINTQTARVVLEVETSLTNFPWETVPGVLSIEPVKLVQ